jgi:hypothetical protein
MDMDLTGYDNEFFVMTLTIIRIPREQMSRPTAQISGTQKTSLHCACS